MASKDPTTRCLEALGVLVLALFLKAKPVTGQETEASDPVEMESPAEDSAPRGGVEDHGPPGADVRLDALVGRR